LRPPTKAATGPVAVEKASASSGLRSAQTFFLLPFSFKKKEARLWIMEDADCGSRVAFLERKVTKGTFARSRGLAADPDEAAATGIMCKKAAR